MLTLAELFSRLKFENYFRAPEAGKSGADISLRELAVVGFAVNYRLCD
jgi:hypothetical protein